MLRWNTELIFPSTRVLFQSNWACIVPFLFIIFFWEELVLVPVINPEASSSKNKSSIFLSVACTTTNTAPINSATKMFKRMRVLHVLPRTWLFMFLKPSKPIKTENQNSETKTIWIKPMWKKNQTHQTIKRSTNQMIKPSKRNRSNGSTQQTEPIKPSNWSNGSTQQTQINPIKPTTDQPIHHHRGNPIFGGVRLGCLPRRFTFWALRQCH